MLRWGCKAPNEVSFMIKGLDKLAYGLNYATHKISQLLLFLMMLLTTGDVAGRYFFNKPITGTYEMTGLMLAMIIFFSLGMAQFKNDHIVIDFLTNKFPARMREGLKAFTSSILFILLMLTTWQMFEYAKRLWTGNDVSGDLGFPMYIFAGLSAIGILFFSLAILADILKSIQKAVQKNES